MTITGIIKRIGAQRSFGATSNGVTENVEAVELELQSGNNTFVGEAYRQVKNIVANECHEGDAAVCELQFTTREFSTKDGGKAYAQRATFINVQPLNPHF